MPELLDPSHSDAGATARLAAWCADVPRLDASRMAKLLHVELTARNGLVAARLAADGPFGIAEPLKGH